eukprot:8179400-Prorocentrum_lima.AAC.1
MLSTQGDRSTSLRTAVRLACVETFDTTLRSGRGDEVGRLAPYADKRELPRRHPRSARVVRVGSSGS